MMFSEKMSKVHILVMKQDVDAVLDYLGRKDRVQISDKEHHDQKEKTDDTVSEPYSAVLQKLKKLRSYLSGSQDESSGTHTNIEDAALPGQAEYDRAYEVLQRSETIIQNEEDLRNQKLQIEHALLEADAFSKMDVPFREIEHLTFLVVRFGKMDPGKIDPARAALSGRGIILLLDDAGKVLAVSTKKGRWALETELKNFDFRELPFPEQAKEIPANLSEGLKQELAEINSKTARNDLLKEEFIRKYRSEIEKLIEQFRIGAIIEDARGELPSSKSVYRISGWIPDKQISETVADLDRLSGGRIAVRTFTPHEIPEIMSGKQKVPVKLKHGRFVSAFEGLVFSYGAPLYGTIDPTLFVAVLFVILFAVMFGDVGQGFVGLLLGLVMKNGSMKALRKFRKFGIIFVVVGAASMISGFLYGSVFSNEHLLVPFTRAITGYLFGKPIDRFIQVMPEEGIGQLFTFFGFTIGIGVIINSIGLLINIYNQLSLKNYYKAFFGKTGLAGASFFWYLITMAVRFLLGFPLFGWEVIILALPLMVIFAGEPLYHIITKKRPVFKDGLTQFFVEGFVEILESVSYYLSNSLSFLRVGAFALSHAVLSLIVFTLAELVGQAPGGIAWGIIVMIIGNTLIIVLEGLIVSIQVVRLQYYEFFSKFFTDSGEEWKPFSFKRKE